MKHEEIEQMVDGALMEGIIEANATTAWCHHCNKVILVRNYLKDLGFI